MRLVFLLLVFGVAASAVAAYVFLGDVAEDDDMRIRREHAERVAELSGPATGGNTEAQYQLANHYFHAHDLTRDLEMASRWFKRAGKGGHAGAQYVLGTMYELGEGVTQDYGEAARWYGRSADGGGHAEAQYALGQLYLRGLGVGVSQKKAMAWFQRAAETGQPVAQYLVGRMFEAGWGVRADSIQAYKWYLLAERSRDRVVAENGEYDPRKARERLEQSLNNSQRRLGKDAAKAWMMTNNVQ